MTPSSRTTGRVRPRIVAVLATVAVGLAVGAVGITNALAATTGAITGYGGKCVDVAAASTANGTQVQLYTCNGTNAQQWTVGDDGTIRALGKCLDVASGSTANGARVQIWDCNGTGAQQWTASAGTLRNPQSNKCLDATGHSSADGTPLQIWDCFGGPNQQWVLPTGGGTPTPTPTTPTTPPPGRRRGPRPERLRLRPVDVQRDDPEPAEHRLQPAADQPVRQPAVRAAVQAGHLQRRRQRRLLHPGRRPRPVRRTTSPSTARVHVEADWFQGNATQNFWRGAENLSVNPPGGTDRWAVSQAAPYRRMHVRGNLQLDDGGWSSGGFIADTTIDGQVRSGSQQQWLSRNTQWGSWTGSNWNMVFVGARQRPGRTASRTRRTPRSAQTPVVREKPFLYIDARRQLPGVRARAADQLDRHQLGRRHPGRLSPCRSASSTS